MTSKMSRNSKTARGFEIVFTKSKKVCELEILFVNSKNIHGLVFANLKKVREIEILFVN